MPGPPTGPGPKEALRETAAEWLIRMHGPDAERARPAFEAWLADHPDHKRMYDRVAVSWEQSRLVTHTPTGHAWEGLPARKPPARRTWAYAVAAGIAALVMVGLLVAHRAPVAGQGLQAAAGRAPAVPRRVTAAERLWPAGMLEFDSTPLREVLAIANRYSQRPIKVGDPSLGELRVTGGYRLGDPAELAKTLAAASGLIVREERGSLVLARKRDPIPG